MPKLSAVVTPQRDRNPQIKAAELENRAFMITDAAGPYSPKAGRGLNDKPFYVFTVVPTEPTPEEVEAGGTFDLLMSDTGNQRHDVWHYFNPENAGDHADLEPIGPVIMSRVDVGQPMPMWVFVDPADLETSDEPVKGKGKAR